ncbi:MAG: MATE family efflux transporter [Bdellovibrionaceae bacterium]|nr:MATE family efflux transporter [Pseudobdellovibrionaceae bacterium]
MTTRRLQKWKEILRIAWPLIIANSFWNLQLTIDRIYLGSHSTEALGAAMAVMGIFWTPMALLQQTAGYLMTFVAQYFGAKQNKMIGPAVWQSLYLSVFGGFLFLFLIPMSQWIFSGVGHSAHMQGLEVEYFNAICYSALPTALVAATSGFFTGLGNTRMVMWINGTGLIFNILFDYLLIFGNLHFPALGVAGAGYATAIANYASALCGLYLLLNKKNEVSYHVLSGWRFKKDLMLRYLKYGLPSGMQWALEGLAFTVFLILIGRFTHGDAALASSGIAVTIMMLAILPAMGIAQSVSILVGQHLGEKKPQLAEESSWSGLQVAAIYIISVGITLLIFPKFYLNWFYNDKNILLWEQVSVTVPYLLMYIALFTAFDSMNLVFSFTLKGAGDTRFVSLVALLLPWPLMVLPTFLIKDWAGAIYWAWAAASLFIISQALVFWKRFTGGKWKSMSVIGPLK